MTADVVHHLRLHGGTGTDAVARRHRAEAAVAGGLPAPRGLPPGALLCVRRLALRLPGGALASLPRQAAPALQRQLDEAWSQALRPTAASPGAAVPALWFADEAELLVFLARRVRAGDTAAWWWPVLAGRQAEPWAALAAAWLRQPQAVPAALVALGAEALAVAEAMGDAACTGLVQALSQAFGMRGWRTGSVGAASPGGAAGAGRADPSALPIVGAALGPAVPQRAGEARGADGQTERPCKPAGADEGPAPGRAGPAHRLVALARVLACEPWAASSGDLAGRVARAAVALVGPASPSSPALRPSVWPARADAPAAAALSPPRPQAVPAEDAVDAEAAAPPRQDGGGRSDAAAPGGAPPLRGAAIPGLAQSAASRHVRCASPHAGLFFLLPLLLRHGCYGDFSQPARPGLALHPAWLLHALLMRCVPISPGDPLPALLQAWAGGKRRPRGAAPSQPWRPWLHALVQALQADAARLLARPPRGTLVWLVRQPGWVQLGASRLDVGFSLHRHPFAIRAAGLDRDIGWLPAAGRVIAFHFDTEPRAAA